MDNAIEYISNFTLAGDWPHGMNWIQMEAPTGYLTKFFSKKYNFNKATSSMYAYQHHTVPVALSTPDGSVAMGVYAPEGQNNAHDGHIHYEGGQGLGGSSYIGGTNKWSVVFRRPRFESGINHQVYKTYICVGTLDMVSNCLRELVHYYPHI